MYMEDDNISKKEGIVAKCQKCGCEEISLQRDGASNPWDDDELYLVCNNKNCGYKQWLYNYYS